MTTPASTPPAAPPPLRRSPPAGSNSALLLLRVITGVVFLAHGAQKIFTFGIPGVAERLFRHGDSAGGTAAPLVSFAELLGGIDWRWGLLPGRRTGPGGGDAGAHSPGALPLRLLAFPRVRVVLVLLTSW